MQYSATILCAALCAALSLTGCAADDDASPSPNHPGPDGPGVMPTPTDPDDSGEPPFVPEQEEFLVRELAVSSSYVFVPNQSEGSTTVARIDGRDLRVTLLEVGLDPREVQAAEVEGIGAVAYVLCEGASTVAIIRDAPDDGPPHIMQVRVPREVNALALSPDGRYAIAYIDPTRPLLNGASVASLQTMALVRLGDAPGEAVAYQLSVPRLLRSVSFTEDSREAYLVGREGIARLVLETISADQFIPTLDLGLSDQALPPEDLELALAPDGAVFVARSSEVRGFGLFTPELDGVKGRLIALDSVPTDIDLIRDDAGRAQVLVTLRAEARALLYDVEAILQLGDEQTPEPVQIIDTTGITAGLAQLTPDHSRALLYSSLDPRPTLGVWDAATQQLRAYPLRNQLRSVALSPDSERAVLVHRPQAGLNPQAPDPQTAFRASHGLTLMTLSDGYQRPIQLDAEPADLILTGDGAGKVYVMLRAPETARQGVLRIDLSSFRVDLIPLARRPLQLGEVAGQVFISQDAPQGRITFINRDTGEQRTISGYELQGRIER